MRLGLESVIWEISTKLNERMEAALALVLQVDRDERAEQARANGQKDRVAANVIREYRLGGFATSIARSVIREIGVIEQSLRATREETGVQEAIERFKFYAGQFSLIIH